MAKTRKTGRKTKRRIRKKIRRKTKRTKSSRNKTMMMTVKSTSELTTNKPSLKTTMRAKTMTSKLSTKRRQIEVSILTVMRMINHWQDMAEGEEEPKLTSMMMMILIKLIRDRRLMIEHMIKILLLNEMRDLILIIIR